MADETTTKKPEKADEPALLISVERLVKDAEGFLGVASAVAAGALHGITKDLSVDQAKAKVASWLTKPEDKDYPTTTA